MSSFESLSSSSFLLPLFPLNLVLFPREPLPLHIFEPRYKLMIRDCLAEEKPFGIVLFEGEEIKTVGTTAMVSQLLHSYDDGRMDIMSVGQKRFRILGFNTEKSYLQARVEYFDDTPSVQEPENYPLLNRSIKAYEYYLLGITHQEGAHVTFYPPYHQVSYQMAASIKGEMIFKQKLLEMNCEEDRLAELMGFFRKAEDEVYLKYPWLDWLRREHSFSLN